MRNKEICKKCPVYRFEKSIGFYHTKLTDKGLVGNMNGKPLPYCFDRSCPLLMEHKMMEWSKTEC